MRCNTCNCPGGGHYGSCSAYFGPVRFAYKEPEPSLLELNPELPGFSEYDTAFLKSAGIEAL